MAEHSDRRQFLKSAATGGTVALTSWPTLVSYAAADALAPGCKVFTIPQAALVAALAEQIIPADDYPGAKEAGVVRYIDGILAGPFGKSYKTRYEDGLAAIDRFSRERHLRDFVSLNSGQQESILQALESGKEVERSAHEFFGMLLQHTFEGYYGDSEHGGNLKGTSWRMIGFAG
jgi:gluconate 2-dehydrogenase gamma chain